MTARAATGWPILLSDLSLILFSVMGAATSQPTGSAAAPETRSRIAAPVAVYRPPAQFDRWLADQPHDPRAILTITARGAGDPAQTGAAALSLARLAAQQGFTVRVMIEPAPLPDLFATFAYDGAIDAGA